MRNKIYLKMKKILVVLPFLLFTACSSRNDEVAQVRFVDLQGRPKKVVTRVPELNASALAAQGGYSQMMKQANPTFNQASPLEQSNQASNNFANPNFAQNQAEAFDAKNQAMARGMEVVNPKDSMLGGGVMEEKVVEYEITKPEKVQTNKNKTKEEAVEISGKKIRKHFLKKTDSEAVEAEIVDSESEKVLVSQASSSQYKGLFVQVGYFSNRNNADNYLKLMSKFHKGLIEVKQQDKTLYRVLLGPLSSQNVAKNLVGKIKKSGHDAIIVRNK